MTQIEIINGKIADHSRKAIQEAFTLPDGRHIVSIYTIGSAISEASKIADWYNSIPIDFNNLDLL